MNPKTTREVYDIMDTLADRRYSQTITDDEYYPAVLEAGCWLTEFELAERIAYAHPLSPEGAYFRTYLRHLIKGSAIVSWQGGRVPVRIVCVWQEAGEKARAEVFRTDSEVFVTSRYIPSPYMTVDLEYIEVA